MLLILCIPDLSPPVGVGLKNKQTGLQMCVLCACVPEQYLSSFLYTPQTTAMLMQTAASMSDRSEKFQFRIEKLKKKKKGADTGINKGSGQLRLVWQDVIQRQTYGRRKYCTELRFTSFN